MSTSRKLRAKLDKQKRSARKAISTEAARKEPVPEPTESSTAETQASTMRGTVTARSARQVLNLFDFATGCRAKNYLQDSVCSLAHFRADAGPVGHTEADDTWNLSELPVWATETFLGSRHSR